MEYATKKIDVESKRAVDTALTKSLLAIPSIRQALAVFTNRFLERFYTDTYALIGGSTINQMCTLSVKGGLGIANLEAQLRHPAPNVLVWDNYVGDCDLNLLINRAQYPQGRTTGEVMAAVSQRTKILLAKTINDTRYSTLVSELRVAQLQPPLYLCSQIEALSHVVDFVAQDLALPVPMPPGPGPAALNPILQLLKDVLPALAGIGGAPLNEVFNSILTSASNDWIVFDDRQTQLLFVADLNKVKSTWTDVDQSFFPYAPGRMDTLGYEVAELAIRQQMDRGFRDDPDIERPEETPYDIFRVTNTPFRYTNRDDSNAPVADRDLVLMQPNETYNVSMYANNLIDDFDLVRAALLFHGFALKRVDVQAAAAGNRNYTIDVRRGTCKCEFVDVAIPRLLAPEWFYLQGKAYYVDIPTPAPPPPNYAIHVCNFDYQVEENLNLVIELGGGLSHSLHKARSRLVRLQSCWLRCNYVTVFPRAAGIPIPPSAAAFQAPASLVQNFTSDMLGLFGLMALPDWLYNEVFVALYQVKTLTDQLLAPGGPGGVTQADVLEAAKELGTIGLLEIQCMADVVDGPMVSELRTLLENGAIEVNWVIACYLLLKASSVPDVIWFPRYGIFRVNNAAAVSAAFQVVTGGPPLAVGDYVAVTWDGRQPGPPLALYTIPAADVLVPGAPNPPNFYGPRLETATRKLYAEVRTRGMASVGQILRVGYGRLMNALLRAANEPYLTDVLT